jgi:2-polyprenyl-3-methyl-5-hydroxy-6-metoxy-1,4-benzoquinol methylase
MCARAIIKSGITKYTMALLYEEGSNPNIYIREINEKANPKLEIQGGIMQEKFMEQIMRGRKNDKRQTIFNFPLELINDINNYFYNTSGDFFDKIPFEPILTDLLLKYAVGNEILEIGSGAGALASWLTERGCKVTCIEPAQELAEKAKTRGLEVYPTTIQSFSSDHKYDSIIAISSLIHVAKADFLHQIQKIANLLNSNGMFFISLIEGENEGFEDPTNTGKLRFFSMWLENDVDAILSNYFILHENQKIYNKKMNRTFLLRVYALK